MRPAEEFRTVGGRFGEIVAGVAPGQWDLPTPVPEWAARDVVGHLVGWFPVLSDGLDLDLPVGPTAEDDPAEAWLIFAGGVQALLDDPASAALTAVNPHFGGLPLPRAISRFFTPDVFAHTWDLATATGQVPALDPGRCEELLAGMEPIEQMLRESGQYGPRVVVPDDADPQTRLMGFLGRDPGWVRPRGAGPC